MKALPMTMEDKCAFVDLISQSSSGGGNQEDEYLYFDLRDSNIMTQSNMIVFFPHVVVDIYGNVLKVTSAQFLELYKGGVNIDLIAVQAKRYVFDVFADRNAPASYSKVDTFYVMNYVGAKQITKEEYNSFINFTEDDFEEVPLG